MTSFQSSLALLKASVGKTITITGEFSEIPWQHLIASTKEYPYDYYFDLDDGFQIVVYSKTVIKKGVIRVKLTGQVILVQGATKRPIPSKGEDFTEYHLLIESLEKIA
jgi:hypothetical protein